MKIHVKRKFAVILFTAIMLAGSVYAGYAQQKRTVSGKVTETATNTPLSGTTVNVKGANSAVTTDADGNFSITAASGDVLVFYFMGYVTQEIEISNQSHIEVFMVEDISELDELIVIGYGTTTKKEVTGSVSSITSDDFKSGNITDPVQLLQGQIAGLNIIRPDGGDPNGSFQIQLRGITTMSGGASPLIVIDGVVGGDLSSLSSSEIQTIDVLRDGSAAAIYGTRATNGVILVTTKKAVPGTSRLEFSSYIAYQTVDKKPDMLTADEFRAALARYGMSNSADHGASTDWFDQVTQSPLTQNYELSSSGGARSLSYRAGISWTNDRGLVKKSSKESLRTRINVSQLLVNDRLRLDYNVTYSTSKSVYADTYILRQAMFHNPTEPIYADENTPAQYGNYYYVGAMEYYNPVAMLEQFDDSGKRKQFTGSINASLSIIDGFKIHTLVSFTETGESYGHYYGKYNPVYIGNDGRAETYNNHGKSKSIEPYLDYSALFNDHRIQAIFGYSYSEQWNESYSAMNYKFDSDMFSFYNLGAGAAIKDGLATMSSSKSSSKLISFFGRVMYNYKEKYLLSASLRHEGSSRFGKNHKWGLFPGLSIGWRLSKEAFMENVKWVNDIKLRAGFGVTGNQEIGNYQSLAILRKGASNFYYNGNWMSTYEPGRNPNFDLKWEKKQEFNIGFDAGIFDNRLNVNFDFYNRRTTDLLYTYSVPVPPNLYNRKFANVGIIDNKGVELRISGIPYTSKNFRWNVTGTISHNTNKLVSFSNADYAMDALDLGYFGDDLKIYTMRIEEGWSLGNFYGPKFLGFDDSGGAKYEDLDGVEGISEADYQIIGNAYPDFIFSLQNTFTYKNFDFSFLIRGSIGNDVLNQTRVYYEGPAYLGTKNILKSSLDSDYTGGAYYSSRFVEDGSFLKLDNITIGYNVSLKSEYISKLRIYITGQNLLTVTGYRGIDPEISLSGLQPGIDWYDFYPRTKTFVAGIKITF
ncbi:MAG: SusC/RagA family TonB-linked outer membrane protein [Prevotellaceae bacterium]|jgi:TonB-linked SusC/RagA family outer membrane protein|nr:SusC/RagA family TonB-linked outer membrane protein [Prevotellaceae bacterium]